MANTHVGIDISKHQLDLAVQGREEVDRLCHDQASTDVLCQSVTALFLRG